MNGYRWICWGFTLAMAACAGDEVEEAVASTADSLALDVGAMADVADTDDSAQDVLVDTASMADASVADTMASDTGAPDTGQSDVLDLPEVRDEDVPDVAEGEDTAGVDDVADAEDGGAGADDTGTADVGDPSIAETCFPGFVPSETLDGPQYDPFEPSVGSHCFGTNQQAIDGVERVVFLGDSVTVGTPNEEYLLSVDNEHFWRNKLASWLAVEFELDTGDLLGWALWKGYDYFSGKGAQQGSGDFHNCSKWGARTDDLMSQIGSCIPDGSEDTTLFVFTMGGNDIAKITQVGAEASAEEVAEGYPEAWALAESTVQYLEEAVQWITDPVNFPNGAYAVFANPFEFTDSTGMTSACTPQSSLNIPGLGEFDLSFLDFGVAELAGFGEWENPEAQQAIVVWILEEYMRIAVDHGVDLVWMLEHFCGHGYVAAGNNADPNNPCYQGPDAEIWFDVTCIHPNAAGHNAIYQMMKATIEE